ncbi:MAG: ABC transporter permease [bacterium]|nr:MAG: ABC transporter permease [bacterium]
MFKNYLKVTFRNLWFQKGYTLINVSGLAIGLLCCLLIVMYVLDELSYDKHFLNSERIYRVGVRGVVGDQDISGVQTSSLMAHTLIDEYPEVLNATRLHHTPNMLVRYGEKVFNETRFMWVDSNFFDVFSIPLVYGDPATALSKDHTVAMTLEVAKKYFDDPSQAIGETVTFEDGTPYVVSAIISNPHPNSHFHYGMLSPLSSWEWNYEEFWLNHFMYTYVMLHKQADPPQLEAKFPSFIEKYVAGHLQRISGMSLQEFEASGSHLSYFLQPLQDIHLKSHFTGELEPNSDIKYVYILSLIAVFILLIASINFMNLATSRSAGRSKEVGVRKVMGSTRRQLILQFLFESVLLTTIAMIIALIMMELLTPSFNNIAGKNLSLGYASNWFVFPMLISITVLVGTLAGSYPAFFLSSFRPVLVLKGMIGKKNRGRNFRNVLVVFQFGISILLFISTFIIYGQMKYIQNKRLGFSKENIVVIKRGWAIGQKPDGSLIETAPNATVIDAFKNDLLANPHIISITGSSSLPGKELRNVIFTPEGALKEEQHPINLYMADYDFARTLNLELVEGRFFSREVASDSLAVVLNESAARVLGYDPPYVGKRVGFPGNSRFYLTIVGVVKDFHYESLHKPIAPLLIGFENLYRTYISVRIRPQDVSETIKYIEQTWSKFIPYKPFEYFFFDDDYDQLYQAEQRISVLFTVFSVLAILIACLGLFGLASFTAERRTKEIGVRKALGASVPNIVFLLSREFTKWVIIANVLAWPLAYYFMNQWLEGFAYRIEINLFTFILASLITLFIALVTVSYQSIRAATINPVEAIRYE